MSSSRNPGGQRVSNVVRQPASPGWRALHGGVLLALLAFVAFVPALRRWPWLWSVPLSGCVALAALRPPLRHSFAWLRAGSSSLLACAATAAVIVLSSTTLVLYH